MKELRINAITSGGCCVYFSLRINEDYTMFDLVRELKRRDYIKFRIIGKMNTFANVI